MVGRGRAAKLFQFDTNLPRRTKEKAAYGPLLIGNR